MFLYRQHHISTASAYLSSITLVLCFWKKKSAERKKSAKEKKKYVEKNSAPLPMIHRSLTFQGWLNSTELNIETKCSTFQQNVTCFKKMWNFHSYLTQSHFHTNMSQFLLIMQTNHRKNTLLKENTFLLEEIVIISLKSASKTNYWSQYLTYQLGLISSWLVSFCRTGSLSADKACSLLAKPFMQRRTHVYTSFYLLGAKNLISSAPVFDLGKSFITV